MCRFALYLGPPISLGSLVTEPENSIIHQSYRSHEGQEPLNGDGFGVAWYVPAITPEPAIFKDITPAWNNPNLKNLAAVTVSGCILAHVRAATPGIPVSRFNCHPFSWGPFALMHNGHIGGFRHLSRRLRERLSDEAYLRLEGSTDSELLLALFADRWQRRRDPDPLERMAAALGDTFADLAETAAEVGVEEPSQLNVALTDGRRAVVSRYNSHHPEQANSLYLHSGSCYVCEGGEGHMLPAEPPRHAVLVASEPLTRDGRWQRVAPGHLVLIGEDLEVEVRELSVAPSGATLSHQGR